MQCPELDSLLADYAAGNLTEKRAADIEKHLESCEGCRTKYDKYRELINELNAMPKVSCPDLVAARILSGQPDEPVIHRRSARRLHVWRAAAAVFIAGMIYVFAARDTRMKPPEYTDAELQEARQQIELALGYCNYFGNRTKTIITDDLLMESIQKPIESSFAKTLNRF